MCLQELQIYNSIQSIVNTEKYTINNNNIIDYVCNCEKS